MRRRTPALLLVASALAGCSYWAYDRPVPRHDARGRELKPVCDDTAVPATIDLVLGLGFGALTVAAYGVCDEASVNICTVGLVPLPLAVSVLYFISAGHGYSAKGDCRAAKRSFRERQAESQP